MQYKKPSRDEKPSELRTVWGVRGGNTLSDKYFSLVFLIACFIMIGNFILEVV